MDKKRDSVEVSERFIASELRAELESVGNGQTILNEAEFGYRNIRSHLLQCLPGARVLEVGSGPCVLLSQLKIDFPHLDVLGIEPIGPGFSLFEETQQKLFAKYNFKLLRTTYEDFADPGRFDFIFLINVFEHLPDWQDFLSFVSGRLEPNGTCVILCPNHGFPYEPHFGVPIVFNKNLTYRLFRNRIDRYESKEGCEGLWESLNFVRWTDVRRAGANHGLEIRFRSSVLREMIERLEHDEAFAQRQYRVRFLARLLLRSGMVRLFEKPAFDRFNPYMLLEITYIGR